jgi:hypothetical protein
MTVHVSTLYNFVTCSRVGISSSHLMFCWIVEWSPVGGSLDSNITTVNCSLIVAGFC